MTDRDWILLKTIAEERNITRAAERLYISQPALTYRLRILEEEFDTQIAIRTPTGILLTPQGEHLVKYASDMILGLTKIKERMAGFGGRVRGPLRIGSSAIFANYELPQILREFLDAYPDVEFFVRTGRSREVSRLLASDEVSMAIIRGEYDWKGERRLLMEESICMVSRSPISIPELPDRPRIVYGTDSSLQALVDEWWHEAFTRPSLDTIAVDTMETCLNMVRENLGWAILPSICLGQFGGSTKEALRWKDGSPLVRRTWICCSQYTLELPAARAFMDFVIRRFEARVQGPPAPILAPSS